MFLNILKLISAVLIVVPLSSSWRPPRPRIKIKNQPQGRHFPQELEWCYGNDSDCGEETWNGACTKGKNQSPIDLPLIIDGEDADVIQDFYSFKHVLPRFSIVNNGQNLEVFPLEDDPHMALHFPPLNVTFTFRKISFHWGRTNNFGSEHSIDGRKLPLEMQLFYSLHKTSGLWDATLESSNTTSIAAVAILFEYDPVTKPLWALRPLRRALKNPYADDDDVEDSLDLDTLLHFKWVYWYMGSLTVPPCHENVVWLVSPKLIKIGPADLEVFRSLTGTDNQQIQVAYRLTISSLFGCCFGVGGELGFLHKAMKKFPWDTDKWCYQGSICKQGSVNSSWERGLCKHGANQSPINLEPRLVISPKGGKNLNFFQRFRKRYNLLSYRIEHRGHTVVIVPPDDHNALFTWPEKHGGVYRFSHIDFHWGPTNQVKKIVN